MLLNALFNKHHYITHDVIASKIQALVEIICCDSKPYSYEEATLSPAWQKSMEKEFDALHANRTWDLVNLPTNKKAIRCKRSYIVKHKDDGSTERFKDRLLVKGYTQHARIDYIETYSPVVKITTVRTLVACVLKKGLENVPT